MRELALVVTIAAAFAAGPARAVEPAARNGEERIKAEAPSSKPGPKGDPKPAAKPGSKPEPEAGPKPGPKAGPSRDPKAKPKAPPTSKIAPGQPEPLRRPPGLDGTGRPATP